MSHRFSVPPPFRPPLEILEGRIAPRASFNAALLSQVDTPLQQAVQRMTQLQGQLSSDLQTMKTDAGSLTFFTESMAQQTAIDGDYARLASDVAQIAALDVQVHAEGNLALQVITENGAFGKHTPKGHRAVTLQALQQVMQTRSQADQIKAAVYAGPPVTQSPIAGQPLEPEYPALDTLSGFPG
jgi:hypothetical protein